MRKIESLHGILYPERKEAPPHAILAYIKEDDYNYDLEMFVRMTSLPSEVQDIVRGCFDGMETVVPSHPDTIAEMKEAARKGETNEKD